MFTNRNLFSPPINKFDLHRFPEKFIQSIKNKALCSVGFSNFNVPDDLDQVGIMALFEAHKRFDPKKGAQFSTYAWKFVKGRILTFLISEIDYGAHKGLPTKKISKIESKTCDIEDSSAASWDEPGFENIEVQQRKEKVIVFMNTFSEREKAIIRIAFWEGKTLQEISQIFGISISMVRKILGRVYRKGRMFFDLTSDL